MLMKILKWKTTNNIRNLFAQYVRKKGQKLEERGLVGRRPGHPVQLVQEDGRAVVLERLEDARVGAYQRLEQGELASDGRRRPAAVSQPSKEHAEKAANKLATFFLIINSF